LVFFFFFFFREIPYIFYKGRTLIIKHTAARERLAQRREDMDEYERSLLPVVEEWPPCDLPVELV